MRKTLLLLSALSLVPNAARANLRGSWMGVAPGANDQAEVLLGSLSFTSLPAIERAGLLQASLSREPWSGYSWPIYRGGLAYRYADPAYRPRADWRENKKYLEPRVGQGDHARLSPAEKYDLLVGDATFSLARAALAEGDRIEARDGRVEPWYGICHGWAPASVAFPAPVRAVTLPAPNGELISFSAEDIRALASLLWAKGKYDFRLVGGRCEEARPARDAFGRPKDPNCLDTNPATWHLALVNAVGRGVPLLLDNTYREEVWNSPVLSYRYRYLRPGSSREYETMAEAWRPIDAADPRRQFRAVGASYLVDVRLVATIAGGRDPAKERGGAGENRTLETEFRYELELGPGGEILGGEWRQDKRPDFLWVVDADRGVITPEDLALSASGGSAAWHRANPVPAAWREAAKRASADYQPLAHIVRHLVEWSR